MVGLPMPGRVRSHIREHDVCFCFSLPCPAGAEHRLKTLRRRRIEKVELQKFDTWNGFHLEHIERDDVAILADSARRNLAPAARRRPKIDDARARSEQFVTIVDFSELERRA